MNYQSSAKRYCLLAPGVEMIPSISATYGLGKHRDRSTRVAQNKSGFLSRRDQRNPVDRSASMERFGFSADGWTRCRLSSVQRFDGHPHAVISTGRVKGKNRSVRQAQIKPEVPV